MPRDDGAEESRKKTIMYKDDVNLPNDRRPKRVIISKSRYKLYEPPQRSNFSVCLDNIKRERQSISAVANQPTTSGRTPLRKPERGSDEFPQPGPSMFTSFARPQSTMVLTERRKLYFKDALVEYKRRRSTAPRRIKIIKVYGKVTYPAMSKRLIP